jgi:phosphohistidine phosphatase
MAGIEDHASGSVTADRQLVVLRHAKAAWPEGVEDRQRPLAERGVREAPLAGRWLRETVDRIQLVVCSPALRARQTWELAAAELDYEPEVRYDDRLYGQPLGTLLEVIGDLPDEVTVAMFVGHNPELSQLVSYLSGTSVELKTSGIAVLGYDGDWRGMSTAEPGSAQLRQFVTPR